MEAGIIEKRIQKPRCSIHITIDYFNKRIRVDDYLGHFQECVEESLKVANGVSAEKIIFKSRKENVLALIAQGFYMKEASISSFWEAIVFSLLNITGMKGATVKNGKREDQILTDVQSLPIKSGLDVPPSAYQGRKAEVTDAVQLAQLYGKVFEVYPTPMNDPLYVKKCMEKGTVFYIYVHEGKIISAASAEIDSFYNNAEITDCATLPEHRQYGLMKHLISALEDYLISNGIYCIYSIARSLSFGMNAALHQQGYSYRGRLANNCYIFDKLEDMNLWVKNFT